MQTSKKKNDKITFVIPNPNLFPSGGNIYNQKLIDALREKETEVEVVDFEGFKKVESDFFFFDTLYFEELKEVSWDDFPSKKYMIVHHLESLYPPKNTDGNVFLKNEKALLEKMDGFLVSSHFTKKYLFENGLGDKNIIVVPPASEGIQKRREVGDLSKVKALMIANLVERKGILEFLFFLEKKIKTVGRALLENLSITIIGSDKLESDYAKKCKEFLEKPVHTSGGKELQNIVHFTGALSSEKVNEYLNKSNLFISTAYMETFGMAMQEAKLSGLPILAYDGGNASFHVEEGKNGFLFSDIESLVEQLLSFLEEKNKLKKITKCSLAEQNNFHYNWGLGANILIKFLN